MAQNAFEFNIRKMTCWAKMKNMNEKLYVVDYNINILLPLKSLVYNFKF